MNEAGIQLTTYFGERHRIGDRFLADALFDLYERHRMHTSVLLRGVEGFGHRHRVQTDRLLTSSESLPAVSIAVDTRERIERALPDVLEVAGRGVITLERVHLRAGGDAWQSPLPHHPGAAIKLTLYGGRGIRSGSEAGYVAAVDRLRAAGAGAASVLLAVDGTLHGERRRARFFARNATVPLVLVAIGDRRSLRALPEVARLLDDPVATVERVRICKSGGVQLGELERVAEQDRSGLPILQKVTVYSEDRARSDGHPLHEALLRRLWEAGAAGATVLRGVRGFYGPHEPFADRVLSLRRNSPVQLIAIDTPSNVRRLWPIIDRATQEAGLVTSELVPASHQLRDRTLGALVLAATGDPDPAPDH